MSFYLKFLIEVSMFSFVLRRSSSSVLAFSFAPVLQHSGTFFPSRCGNSGMKAIVLAAKQTSSSSKYNSDSVSFMEESISGYKAPTVNWYPGHIAKAERTLAETLNSADLLLEVRDARIPAATAHPRVREWAAGKPRIVVLTRVDMVPNLAVKAWVQAMNVFGGGRWDGHIQDGNLKHREKQAMKERGAIDHNENEVESVLFVDAKRGQGMPALMRAISKAGAYVNDRRNKRGLRERPLRVAVLGYPNVGKSALINRILGRKRAKSANTPGITRGLQWIRVKTNIESTDETGKTRSKKSNNRINGDFELLDSPGIIPANMENQDDAILLAICNSIGNAAYDNQGVAAYLCERLKTIYKMGEQELTAPQWREKVKERYCFDPLSPITIPSLDGEKITREMTGEDMLYKVAENTCYGDCENASRKILQDFRNGRMGNICLQIAPNVEDKESVSEGQVKLQVLREVAVMGEGIHQSDNSVDTNDQREDLAKNALKIAKEKGLQLPPVVENEQNEEKNIGKGLFDGW